MATIDELDFKLILDDQEFNAKVKNDIKLAEELNTSLSSLLDIKKKVGKFTQDDVINNKKANKILEDNAKTQEKITREKNKTLAAQQKLNAQIEKSTKGYAQQSRILSELKGLALGYLSIHGASQLLSSLVSVTGEFELQKTTLAAMLGDLNEAEAIISNIQGLSVNSIFQFKDLAKYTKQLSAFSVPARELYDTTKMLADVSAGLGVGMDRIVLAYGQVRSAAFLRGQEVRQFTEAGIPILDELAKQFTELEGRAVSTGEVFDKISARLVPFEMVAKVFKDMTSEGGKFYNMQQVQAETLKGKLENLKDAYEIMLNEIGSAHSDKIKGSIDWLRQLMQNWEQIGGQIVDLIKLFGLYKGAVALLSISDTIAKFGGLANAIKKTAAAQALMNSALLTNPYIAVGTVVATVAIAINRQRKALSSATIAQAEYNKRVSDLAKIENDRKVKIQNLIDTIQDETVATLEREAALLALKESYPKIFEKYDLESLKLADILRLKKEIAEEDAKQKRLSDLGAIGAQSGRIKALTRRGASDRHVESALAYQREMEKDYLSKYILPDIVSGLKDLTDDALSKALDDAFRKSKYNTRGVEVFDGIPTTQDFYEDLYSAIQSEISRRKSEKPTTGWRKKVQDELTKLNLTEQKSFGLWAKDTTQSTQYVDDLIKRYRELKEQLKWVSSFDPNLTKTLNEELTAIKAVSKALNIDIEDLSAKKSDTKAEKEERRLKRLIDSLRTLQDQYEKLKKVGASDESIKTLFKGLYPDLIAETNEGFVTSLNYLEEAKKLIAQLGKLSPEDAKKLLIDIGGDKFQEILDNLEKQQKAYKDSAKAAGEYFDTLRKWATEDFNINGEGLAFDVSKIASDLNQKIDEIEFRATKAKELFAQIDVDSEEEVAKVKELFVKEFGEDAWTDFWNPYTTQGIKAIENLAEKQAEYERKLAQEKVNDLAQKYVKESYFAQGIELSDLGDKTFFQLRDLRKKLQATLDSEPLNLSVEIQAALEQVGVDAADLVGIDLDTIFHELEVLGTPIDEATQSTLKLSQQIQKAGLSTEKFGSVVKKVFEGDLKNLAEEEGKALASMVMDYLDQLSKLFETIGEYAQTAGNDTLKEAANGLTEVMDVLGPMAQKFASGDWVGGIISGVTALASKIFQALNAQEQLARAIEETAIQQRILNSEYAIMDGVSGAFGEDSFKKFTNAYKEATKAYQDVQKDIEKSNKNLWGGTDNDSGQWGKVGGLAAGAALGAAIGSIFPVIGTALGAGVGALVGMIAGTVTDAALEMDNYVKTLEQMASEIGAPLINEDTGAYNLETLEAIKDTYKDLSAEDQKWLDNAIANTQIYENALDSMADYMSSVFGNVADDIADAFITSFKESGEAALEYGDIMDGVSSQIAKDIIKSTLLQEVFNEDLTKNAAKELASGNAAGAMAIVDEAMKSAQMLAPYIQDFLQSMEPYFEMNDTGGKTSLGEGIKGITEDQANLLASYLNAIRSDVSYSKAIWLRMDTNLQKLADMLVSSPTLMEYQAQIAANTYDTAVATQEILAELRSVVTYDSGDGAIRVHS